MTSRITSYLTIGGLLLTLGGCNTVEPAGGKAAADKPSGMASAMPTSAGPVHYRPTTNPGQSS